MLTPASSSHALVCFVFAPQAECLPTARTPAVCWGCVAGLWSSSPSCSSKTRRTLCTWSWNPPAAETSANHLCFIRGVNLWENCTNVTLFGLLAPLQLANESGTTGSMYCSKSWHLTFFVRVCAYIRRLFSTRKLKLVESSQKLHVINI